MNDPWNDYKPVPKRFLWMAIGIFAVLIVLYIVLTVTMAARAEEPSAAPQRAFIIANMAQQLGSAEIRADALQSELVKAQKEVEDWKDTFHAWCGTAPNCGRPDK